MRSSPAAYSWQLSVVQLAAKLTNRQTQANGRHHIVILLLDPGPAVDFFLSLASLSIYHSLTIPLLHAKKKKNKKIPKTITLCFHWHPPASKWAPTAVQATPSRTPRLAVVLRLQLTTTALLLMLMATGMPMLMTTIIMDMIMTTAMLTMAKATTTTRLLPWSMPIALMKKIVPPRARFAMTTNAAIPTTPAAPRLWSAATPMSSTAMVCHPAHTASIAGLPTANG